MFLLYYPDEDQVFIYDTFEKAKKSYDHYTNQGLEVVIYGRTGE